MVSMPRVEHGSEASALTNRPFLRPKTKTTLMQPVVEEGFASFVYDDKVKSPEMPKIP